MNRQPVNRGAVALLFLVASLLSSGAAVAQSPTFSRTDYPSLADHIAADLNGDGRVDLAGLWAKTAVVMLGNGDGTFQPRVEYPVASWNQAVAAGDFNRDGASDLMVTLNDPNVGLSLLTGRGDGTFGDAVSFPNSAGFDTPAIAAVDLDNDGNLDVVLGHQIACYQAPCIAARVITVMRGNGDGTFQAPQQVDVGMGTAAIAAGDFDRDGSRDLALASDSSRVRILLGAGDGTFRQQYTVTFVPENNIGMDNTDIDLADVNGDTIDDLVVAMSLNGSKTVILIGNGDGTFRDPHFIQEPGQRIPQFQAVADYNGDGHPDLALALGWGTQGLMEILNGNGDGTFGPPTLYLVPPPLSSIGGLKIVASDFDSNGKPDLALVWGGASTGLAVLRNTTGLLPPPRPIAPSLLSPPDGVAVTQPVTLDWSDVAHATAYHVQVDTSSTFGAPYVANVTATVSQATLSGLPAQRLFWRVRARNSAGVFGPYSATRRFTPQPVPAIAALSSIALSPATVAGGAAVTATVTLTGAAPGGGAVIALASSNTAAAAVAQSVTINAGSTGAVFTVTTGTVTAVTGVTISATYGGVTRSAALTITPPGQAATLSVTATGRSGERVFSSPSGISVPVGSTGSASFDAGTSVTLSVSDGRDAVWSGACSSGGEKRRTCTFTLTANASVTANVQ